MRAGRYITTVVIAGFVLIAVLAFITPDQMATQLPLILAGIATASGVFYKLGETDSKIEAAAAISQTNAVRLEIQADQLQRNTVTTEKTHLLVNSQHDLLVSQLEAVKTKLAHLEASSAAKATAQSHADATEARIIGAIEGNVTKST